MESQFLEKNEPVPDNTDMRSGGSGPVPVLEVVGLVKRYGSLTAVDRINFEVYAGEIFGLLGPNGAGKTSTLECILGLRKVDAGSVLVAGINAVEQTVEVRKCMGAQLQSTALPDKMTPREALRLFGSFYGITVNIEETLHRYGLADKGRTPFASLSGGQQQRLSLALALIHTPRLIVLDEPTAGLDPVARRELLDLVVACRDQGCAVLMSTHHLDEAERLCDRLAILDGGVIVCQDNPDALVEASSSRSQVRIRTAGSLDKDAFTGIKCSGQFRKDGDAWVSFTSDPGQAVVELLQRLKERQVELLGLEVRKPSLEDVFFEYTGRQWPDAIERSESREQAVQ